MCICQGGAFSEKAFLRFIVLETVFVCRIFLFELLNIHVSKLCFHTPVRKQHSAVVVGERGQRVGLVCAGY